MSSVSLGEAGPPILRCQTMKPSRGTCCAVDRSLLYNVGALIIRIGFWGFLILIIVYYTPKPYSND